MENLNELLKAATRISETVERVLNESEFSEYGDLSGFDVDCSNPDQLFLKDELQNIAARLQSVSKSIKYLNKPATDVYTLRRNASGRYECELFELTSGSTLEALVFDTWGECFKWVCSRIEHNGEDYYLYGHDATSLEGLQVRFRE